MQEAIARMLERYTARTLDQAVRALREIIQEVALLGLWRARFFEHAAFYGGTALRILHGLDRFSEDLDFSLLQPRADFDLSRYLDTLAQEIRAFGFEAEITLRSKAFTTAIQSAFLKANTRHQLLEIGIPPEIAGRIPPRQTLKIKFEVDTDPPPGFATRARYLLQPIPFSVRALALPDLFAGKMHAVLCRRWANRVKGRDWYDFVWFVANHPHLHLHHLEQRMRQTEHWAGDNPLMPDRFLELLHAAIDRLDVHQARSEVEPFVRHPAALDVWCPEFFHDIAARIQFAAHA